MQSLVFKLFTLKKN